MSEDEKFDTWLIRAARDYNAPPGATPRDAMWPTIRTSLDAAAHPPVALHHAGAPARVRPARVWQWGGLAAAAALLLVVGYQLGRRSEAPSATVTAAAPDQTPGGAVLYDRAAASHLGRADALLTSVRSMIDAGQVDETMKDWARELLADTRLLIDSPAANDLTRRRLLRDLELTLAQIVQLSAAATLDDQHMVERALQRGELLTRIRTTVPSVLNGT